MEPSRGRGEDRAFQEMRRAALLRLEGRPCRELAERTRLALDGEGRCFSLSSLGREIRISTPGYEITPEVGRWHHLLILHYLDMADGTELTGELMRFGDLPGGLARGGGFDRESEGILSRRFGAASPERLRAACRALGARVTASNADLCAVFPLFPLYPITLKLWYADEELPGSGRLLLDRSAAHFLSLEDAVTAGTILLEELERQYRQLG